MHKTWLNTKKFGAVGLLFSHFPVFRGEEGGGCPHGAGGREVVLLLTAGTAQPSAQANYPPVANNIRTS